MAILMIAAIVWGMYQLHLWLDRTTPGVAATSTSEPAKTATTANAPGSAGSTGSAANDQSMLLSPDAVNAVVIISGPGGKNTGFVCNFRGKIFVATSQDALNIGAPLVLTVGREVLTIQQIYFSQDANIALIQCASIPKGIVPFEVASITDKAIVKNDPAMVLAFTRTTGDILPVPTRLYNLEPQRIDVGSVTMEGGSGSPIIDLPTKKVVGVIVTAEFFNLEGFEQVLFTAPNGGYTAGVTYFGQPMAALARWEPLNWNLFQQNEAAIRQARTEINAVMGLLGSGRGDYHAIKELADTQKAAADIYFDRRVASADKAGAFDHVLTDASRYARRTQANLEAHKYYYCQQIAVANLTRLAHDVTQGIGKASHEEGYVRDVLRKGR